MEYDSISKKFQYTILTVTFSAIAMLAVLLIIVKYTDCIKECDSITEIYFKEQENIVKYEVDRAVKEIQSDLKTRNQSIEESKTYAIEKYRNIRFPNKGKELGFFFIRSYDGIQWLSVSLPELEGTDVSKRKDPDGITTHDLYMDIVKKGGGYADYSWYNPVTKDVQKKRSYIKGIPELECYIGAGFWFDDINTVIDARKDKLINDVKIYILGLLVVTIIFYLIIYFIIRNISKKIKASFFRFSQFFENAAQHNAMVETSDLHYKEFSDLAQSANKMITERIRAEEDVRVMAHALKSINDCVVITDLDNKILYTNDAFSKTYGYQRDEIIGEKMERFGSSKNPLGVHREVLNETLKYGWEGELWNTRKDGSEFQIYLSSSVVKNVNGETVALVGVSKDITDEKRNELLQKIIFNIAQAANISDDLDGLIEIIKDQLQQIIDIKNFYIAFYNEEDDTFSSPYMMDEKDSFKSWPAGKTLTAYVYKTGKPQLLDYKKIEELNKSGAIELLGTLPKVWLGVPLKIKGKAFGVFAVQSYSNETTYTQSDLEMLKFVSHQMSISLERKKVDEALHIAYEKAKESDRLKSAFLATMSHELRTPLNAVIGFSDLLKDGSERERMLKYAEIINNSGRHLLEIVEDIFDVTLLEVGQVQLQKKDYLLSDIMNNIHEMIEAERLKLGSDVEINYNPEAVNEKIEVYTDKGKLIQILLNLLKNALKFTKEGTIEYGYQKVAGSKKNIRFFVKDTGIGIADDKHEVIFNIFRQVDETLTRNYGGTGIGLFVVKKYTELLGGEIELISKEGKGSIFYVTLPVLNSTREKDPGTMESVDNTNWSGKTVMVVEDDEFSASFLVEVLKGLNINHLLARNGKEAIQIFEKDSAIDLVLMDLTMPEMDGYEATKLLKEKDPGLVIIAQTAHAIPGDKEKTLEAGFNDYISKPILLSELNQILKRYLNN